MRLIMRGLSEQVFFSNQSCNSFRDSQIIKIYYLKLLVNFFENEKLEKNNM